MPVVFESKLFLFEADQTVPDHVDEWVQWRNREIEEDKHHIERYDLEHGVVGMIAINLESPEDAAMMLAAAIKHARDSNPCGMTNMDGFAIVGPHMEGQDDSQKTTGIGWRLRLGYDLPQETVATLLGSVPQMAPKLRELCMSSAELVA